ncbi:MAG: hypothetical protein EPN57_20525 [Paraburkholderia sp.]|nr:MAG: hypothetical protein EPN57_20525 [Paraburkholderia sp.]
MPVRAKFMLSEVTTNSYNPAAKKFKFTAQYDPSIPEDQRFQKATPWGEFEMQVDNPAAAVQFELGKQYYIDFTPADIPAAAQEGANATQG